ncbi:MAG: 16S rRNA (adenine(1518)-N(6)/adenine(1519)-N(6))-dimethyltransferase RsmA [Firmicutes bacterium]|nr:16S rRNA (adenine(1518)-N(6)/adenine(1519)-N(6))-dimethyltransferase RsmA [Bacillota bacterium]
MIDPRTPSQLEQSLSRLGLAPAHRWGQHFLVDRRVLDRLARLAREPDVTLPVFEIGPGAGGLTRTLLEDGRRVLGLELDTRLEPLLAPLADAFPGQATIVYGDALTTSWADLVRQQHWDAVTVVGNLPYYITAPLLERLMEFQGWWRYAVLMVQREVAERLATEPGLRDTSQLSVLLRYYMAVDIAIGRIPRSSFYPPPAVESAVLQLKARTPLPVPWEAFRWVVRAGFQYRRKTLRQALAQAAGSWQGSSAWQQELATLSINPSARAEQLTLDEWVRLAQAVAGKKKGWR